MKLFIVLVVFGIWLGLYVVDRKFDMNMVDVCKENRFEKGFVRIYCWFGDLWLWDERDIIMMSILNWLFLSIFVYILMFFE